MSADAFIPPMTITVAAAPSMTRTARGSTDRAVPAGSAGSIVLDTVVLRPPRLVPAHRRGAPTLVGSPELGDLGRPARCLRWTPHPRSDPAREREAAPMEHGPVEVLFLTFPDDAPLSEVARVL